MLRQIMKHLEIEKKVDFARYLGIKPNVLSNWFSRDTFDEDIITQKCEFLNPIWIKTGMGPMLKIDEDPLKGSDVFKRVEKTNAIEPPIAIESKKGTIPITDISVAAGSGYLNQDHIEELDTIILPERMMNSGKHLCVRVKGNSMAPTLHDSGYIVIRFIDKGDWNHIANEHVYVIADNEGRAFLKRIKNRFKKGFITLMSDNPDKATYPNFNLQFDEINTIWHVEWYISAKMPNIHDQYYSRLQALENRLDDMELKLLHKN